MTSTEISVTLPAIDPMALLDCPAGIGTPFIRIVDGMTSGAGGAVDVEIRGTEIEVMQFIADNWGDEEAQYQRDCRDPEKFSR